MKFLYVANFSHSWETPVYIADSLEELGHEIKRIPEKATPKKIIKNIQHHKPDVLLFTKGNILGNLQKVLDFCKENDILTVCWLFDLYFGLAHREPEVYAHPRFKADVVLTTDGGHQEKFEALGINHICLRQGIYQKEAYISKNKRRVEEIVFIGSCLGCSPHRPRLIEFLQRTYKENFGWYGKDKDNQVRGKDLNNLLASTKIVVGDSVLSPNYWSNRVYEILGRGGFLLHPKVPGLEKEFTYWKHFVPYDAWNFRQLEQIIDYYLTHDKEREKIKKEGHKFCKQNYTYLKRCQKLIEIINEQRAIKKSIGARRAIAFTNGNEGNVPSKENDTGQNEKIRTFNSRSSSEKESPERVCRFSARENEGVTAILLPYTRKEQYSDWLKNIKSQKGVNLTIWTWDSTLTLPEKEGVLTFRDPYNFGVYWRWELAKYVSTKYVLLLDDDVFFKDEYVLRDTIEAKKKYPEDTVVGWKGVILKGKYSESVHIRSEKVKKDTKVDFVKVNYLLFERDALRKTKILPFEILEIDEKADGEFWYLPQMGEHYVIKCLSNRLDNSRTLGKGKETRKDHFKKQNKLVEFSLKCHRLQKK